jgi:hypothetical protein
LRPVRYDKLLAQRQQGFGLSRGRAAGAAHEAAHRTVQGVGAVGLFGNFSHSVAVN